MEHTFARLATVLQGGAKLKIKHIYMDDYTATVEMEGISLDLQNKPFKNNYCWIVRFNENKKIMSVRAYLDSALVQHLFDVNTPLIENS